MKTFVYIRLRRVVALVTACALVLLFAPAVPVVAEPVADHLVISQIYGASSSAGAPYDYDFIEIYNPTGAPTDLHGLSLRYSSAANDTSSIRINLTGAVAPGRYALVRLSHGGQGSPLPYYDLVGSPAQDVSKNGARVALVRSEDSTFAMLPGTPGLIDLVGYGGATGYEGSAAAPIPDMQAIIRQSETDDNAADFVVGDPVFRGSGVLGVASSVSATAAVEEFPPSLTFSLSAGTAPAGGSVTASSIGFGTLKREVPKTGSHILSVTTNADNGYSVTAGESGPLASPTAGTIPNVSGDPAGSINYTTAGPWDASTIYGFGYTLSGSDAAFTLGYKCFADASVVEPAQVVMGAQVPVESSSVEITYKVNASPAQLQGDYATTITYIAIGNF